MPDQPELIGYLIVIVWVLAVVGLIYLIDACNKKFRGMVLNWKARRILRTASQSEVIAARCKVMDARKDRSE